ncbi:MAG: RNA methyltransferase [Treponema sp.]|jgi:tRNA/rRNA methyltransferase/tRNA (cytidine32/uridine32-2'-O)-methyltransferase|nr:RNA methyltransferase [Treponema sp.]
MTLKDIVIVLCRPAETGNVGAVCRAMKNMGLSRLRLVLPPVLPHPGDTQLLSLDEGVREEILTRAVHAGEIWEGAGVFTTLDEAIRDCTLVVGTTRRRGHDRKQTSMTPGELADFFLGHPGPAALVFGNERTGLDDAELSRCSLASHIPASRDCPSLNLSHAVQLYAYEIYQTMTGRTEPVKGQWVPLRREAVEELVGKICENLKLLGFYQQPGRKLQERFFRDLFSRAALTEREASYFTGIIAKAVRLALKKA